MAQVEKRRLRKEFRNRPNVCWCVETNKSVPSRMRSPVSNDAEDYGR